MRGVFIASALTPGSSERCAGEEQILQAERRLKTMLPEYYREFLTISNGWPTDGPYVTRILPVEEIAWVSEWKRDWL